TAGLDPDGRHHRRAGLRLLRAAPLEARLGLALAPPRDSPQLGGPGLALERALPSAREGVRPYDLPVPAAVPRGLGDRAADPRRRGRDDRHLQPLERELADRAAHLRLRRTRDAPLAPFERPTAPALQLRQQPLDLRLAVRDGVLEPRPP